MLFWGNERILWLAIAGVMIISLLLIRVGIAHFQREYLLGREIDVINLGWIWRTSGKISLAARTLLATGMRVF